MLRKLTIGTLIARPLCSKVCDALKNDDYSQVASMYYSTISFDSIIRTLMNLSCQRSTLDQALAFPEHAGIMSQAAALARHGAADSKEGCGTYWYADGAVYEGEYPYTPIPLNPEIPENLP